MTLQFRTQNTIANIVSFSGIGIHTGKTVHMRFLPAEENSGIVFRRVDLPTPVDIPATVAHVIDTERCTTIGSEKAFVHTVEHVLAALKAYSIDNVIVELDSYEPPVADGSAYPFVCMIEKAQVFAQKSLKPSFALTKPLYFSEKDVHIIALPYDGFRISYTLNYPDCKALKAQFYSFDLLTDSFKEEISKSRTFSMYSELSMLIDLGLIKGGSLDNAVVVQGEALFSKEGIRYPEEPCRHKILDIIGDLSLIPFDFTAHIVSIRSGHKTNFQLSKLIYEQKQSEYETWKNSRSLSIP